MTYLPPQFEQRYYRQHNSDLRKIPDAELKRHYSDLGEADGRLSSAIGNRAAFFALAANAGSILEIGQLASPSVSGPERQVFR